MCGGSEAGQCLGMPGASRSQWGGWGKIRTMTKKGCSPGSQVTLRWDKGTASTHL